MSTPISDVKTVQYERSCKRVSVRLLKVPRHLAGAFMLCALAGCESASDTEHMEAEAEQRALASADGAVDCLRAGDADFRTVCWIDRSHDGDGALILTVNHPDGAFRRLKVTTDGQGIVAADGSEAATVSLEGADTIHVEIAGEQYRLPAKVAQR